MSIYLGNNLIAPNQSNAANKSLSNLDSTGQSILDNKADRDLSNLSTTGQTALDNKADISFSNVNNTAKILMSGMGMPSDTYINLTLGASGSTYTAPANGYYYIATQSTYAGQGVFAINNHSLITTGMISSNANQPLHAWIPAIKGQIVSILYQGNVSGFNFIYAQGSESEAN